MSTREVCYILIGSTRVGKSTFGNRLLGKDLFEAKFSMTPVTDKPEMCSNQNNGVKTTVIDTVGFNDAGRNSNNTVAQLAEFLQKSNVQINHFVLMQNCHTGLTDDMTKNIRMLFNSFKDGIPLNNISIVLTHMRSDVENASDIIQQYRDALKEYFHGDSICDKVININIYLIDNCPHNPSPVPQNLDPSIPNHPSTVPGSDFDPPGYEAKREKQYRNEVINTWVSGDVKYGTRINQYRWKITPFSGSEVNYTEWKDIESPKTIELARIRRRTESRWQKRKVCTDSRNSGIEHIESETFEEYREERVITTDFDGVDHYGSWDKVSYTVKRYEIRTITKEYVKRVHGDNNTREVSYGKQKKVVRIDYSTGTTKTIEDWYVIPGSVKFSHTEYWEFRNMKDKQYDGNDGGILWVVYYYTIYQWTERRLVKKYSSGYCDYGDWEMVPGSKSSHSFHDYGTTGLGVLLAPVTAVVAGVQAIDEVSNGYTFAPDDW